MLLERAILFNTKSWAQAMVRACSLINHNLHAKSL